ncbi:hypothetical protein C2I36_12515 [Rhodobacteraceae bacterium WD3A24]|nr:hypothetical protein C2I36_12515 [Rhodobacteraceae bacterium WD3A24]
MAFPLAPVAGIALRYGVVALAAYGVARRVGPARVDQRVEDAFDEVPEGIGASRAPDRGQVNAAGRMRRVIRLGRNGPGVEIDLAGLGRLRMRRQK